MMVPWQRVKELHVGIESSSSVTPVGFSNHRAARSPGELGRLTGFLFAQKPHLHYRTCTVPEPARVFSLT